MLLERAERVLSTKSLPYALDLACGDKKKEGYIGVDINPRFAEICWNLEQYPWPFADSSVDKIHCTHFIEHVDDIIKFMNELYRVCRNDAIVYIEAPYYSHIMASQDPTHKRLISEMSFLYFDKNWRKDSGLLYYPIRSDFRIKKLQFGWDKSMVDASDDEKQFAREHYLNVIASIGVIMQCFKEEAK